MECQNLLAKHLSVHLCVDFGGGNLFVSEHHLDGAEVGSSLEQMGGKSVAEGVGADLLLNASLLCISTHDVEDHHAAQLTAEAVQEDMILEPRLHRQFITEGEVVMDLAQGRRGDGDDSLFAALAIDHDVALLFEDVGDTKVREFGDA